MEIEITDRDKAQIQGLVAYGHAATHARHFVLHVENADLARQFLQALCANGRIASACANDGSAACPAGRGWCRISIGFTHAGLERLELPEDCLRVFGRKAPAFKEGAFLRAACRLGDTGPSSVDHWEACFHHAHAHVLICLHADSPGALESRTGELMGLAGSSGLRGWRDPLDGAQLYDSHGHRIVHFGLRDDVSRVTVSGLEKPGKRAPHPPGKRVRHAPGEFLLGYANNEGYNPWLIPSGRPGLLASQLGDIAGFFRNGSFAAFRKMEQDEAAFREFVERAAAACGVDRAYIVAKLSGRWEDGSVVRADAPGGPPPAAVAGGPDLDDFDFESDQDGFGCPFGAHIRRMNPRGDRRVIPFGTRPLIRRGMPYGAPWSQTGRAGRRGLLGLFFCASLEEQFEHLVGEWADKNPMGPDNRGNSKDPLIGNHGAARSAFDIPMQDGSSRALAGFRPFVRTRGTLYAFFPSLPAIALIARAGATTTAAAPAAPPDSCRSAPRTPRWPGPS